MRYTFDSNYEISYKQKSDQKIEKTRDELEVSNNFSYIGDKVGLELSFLLSSQILNERNADGLICSSFLSPGKINYSLGIIYENSGKLDTKISIDIASIQMTTFLNQGIYDNNEDIVFYDIEKGQLLSNIFGITINYTINESSNIFKLKHKGNIFIPCNKESFDSTWAENFNMYFSNEICIYKKNIFKLALISKLIYNKYGNKELEFYNKLSLGITIGANKQQLSSH